jgi:hypothetical protein
LRSILPFHFITNWILLFAQNDEPTLSFALTFSLRRKEKSELIKESVSNPFGDQSSHFLDGRGLIGFVDKDIRGSPEPSRFGEILFLPNELPGPIFQGEVKNDGGLVFQNKTGAVIGDRVDQEGLDHALHEGVRFLAVHDLHPSVPDEFPQKSLGKRDLYARLKSPVDKRRNGEGADTGRKMGLLSNQLVAATQQQGYTND